MFHSKILFLHFIFKAHCSVLSDSLLAHLPHLIHNFLFPVQQFSAFTVGANVCVSFIRKSFEFYGKKNFFLPNQIQQIFHRDQKRCGLVKGHVSLHQATTAKINISYLGWKTLICGSYMFFINFQCFLPLEHKEKFRKHPTKKNASVQKVAQWWNAPHKSEKKYMGINYIGPYAHSYTTYSRIRSHSFWEKKLVNTFWKPQNFTKMALKKSMIFFNQLFSLKNPPPHPLGPR